MICDPIAYTGVHVGPLVILAVICLVAGGLLLLMSRRRGKAVTAVLLVLISCAAMAITAGTPTRAVADECPPVGRAPVENYVPGISPPYIYPPSSPADNSLTITQTSVMAGMAPGIDPVPIAGIVTNNGADSTYIYLVDVEITGVTPTPIRHRVFATRVTTCCWTRGCQLVRHSTRAARQRSPGPRSASATR